MDHPSCSKRHSVSIVSSNNRYYDADALTLIIQLAQLIVPGNVFLQALSFDFRLQPGSIFHGITPSCKELLLIMRIGTGGIEQIGVKLPVITFCDCVHSDDGKVDRLQSAMAKRVMRTRRMPVFCEIASVKLQAYFTMCFSFVVVYPLDPLGKTGRFPRKNRSFNGLIVQ